MSGHSLFRHALPYSDDSLETALRDEALSLPEFPAIPFAVADEDLQQVEAEFKAARAKAVKPLIDRVIVPDGEQGRLLYDMMRASPAFFAHEVLTGPLQLPYNGRFLVSEHHEAWDDLITRYKRICVEAARDHGKSFFFDFAFPLWNLSMHPGSIGFIFSGTQSQAIRILGDIKAEIEGNPRLTWLQPQIKRGVQWSSTCIQCSNGARIYARGFGTKVRGAHPDWIVVDDGLNDETIYSETVRLKQIDYFYSAISNMLIPGGQLIVVGTPFTVQDLYADLAKNTEYVFRKFPALDDAGNPLWPARYSAEALAAKQREVGSVRFTREFMCEPISDDMSLFPGYLFEGEQVEQPTVKLGAPLEFWKEIGIVSVAMGVDFALSTSAKADYTVIFVMGRDGKGNRWIMDIVRGHGAAYQSQLSKIIEVARLYEPDIIFVESNQAQQIFGDELIRNTDLPIHKFVTGVQKHALDKGVPSLRVLLENGKIKIPRGDKRSVEMTNIWRDEMRAFTWANGKLQSVINHDDCVMANWICEQAIRHGGFAFDFGTDMDYDSPEEKVASMAEVMKELTGDADTKPVASGNLVDDVEVVPDVEFDGDLPVMRGAEKPNEAALRGTWE